MQINNNILAVIEKPIKIAFKVMSACTAFYLFDSLFLHEDIAFFSDVKHALPYTHNIIKYGGPICLASTFAISSLARVFTYALHLGNAGAEKRITQDAALDAAGY